MSELHFETKLIHLNGVQNKIILQNENGPCALIALTNILLLSPNYSYTAQTLIEYVNRSETVLLSTLIQILANIGIQFPNGDKLDINQLLQLLPKLHNGLNINPKFNGTFVDGPEMSLFRLYNVGVVHGWMIDPEVDPVAYQHVTKYSYEDAQNVLIQAYDITTSNLDVANKEEVVNDAGYIKSFLARSATQLTNYGLEYLKSIIMERSFVIFFRNDHFSTLYKLNNELYTLVTDLGFKNQKDIVWQSLKSVNGSNDLFYTGDFITRVADENNQYASNAALPIGNVEQHTSSNNPFSDPQNNENTYTPNVVNGFDSNAQQNPIAETDEDLARRLQEEEDERYAGNMQRSYNREANNRTEPRSTTGNKDKKDDNKKRKYKLNKKNPALSCNN
ncbi:hypothetical protein TPHA_0J02310 [Tetrapisispora phaffii CBS 4417]|uniref:MINDY deubiquitinase domain-containing protein n=1 Tax=Tetrapisispora phaffii (strain ATCC 24235 / CBS 4417 / NBRC 1672 / NRRL Y-8282 / UCD 70-5) TaxID=1071381 RepID=G8BYV9_TETPH|nr:hypothetical protein TPHA_0J02310 [Tetrapisispora phaffii CBS 4417]CCE65051.1 hypothetical protein TPHA_0J02310 [Tetrapisispora phaffii CBS 4417]